MANAPMTRTQMETALCQALTAQGLFHPAYAVVAPVVWAPACPHLLIEVRAQGISQAGDPCFPGGRIESGETPAQAAARELREELGILADPAQFYGQLPTVQTYLGQKTDVFVCGLSPEEAAAARVNPGEVSALLRVPMSCFLARPRDASFSVDGHVIWGMTAGAIRHLCEAWVRAGLPGQP